MHGNVELGANILKYSLCQSPGAPEISILSFKGGFHGRLYGKAIKDGPLGRTVRAGRFIHYQ